jgi:hypothetical protein
MYDRFNDFLFRNELKRLFIGKKDENEIYKLF